MAAPTSVVTPARFAAGMTFEQYLAFIGSPANLEREGSGGAARRDMTAQMRQWYDACRLSEAQAAAARWLTAQPGGPAKMLVISEEWSSDCRRDVPMLARLAEAADMEMRIFTRDGRRFGASQAPSLAEAPDSNADLMAEFMNEKNGQRWQSIPVAAFYTKDLELLYRYVEYPAVYRKDRLADAMQTAAARLGGTKEETWDRFIRDWGALQQSPFFLVWQSAAIDEMLSALHERLVVGSLT